jgi:hypothetical protein
MKKRRRRKNPEAVKLGRRGGKARVKKLTAEERRESSRKAALARWTKWRKDRGRDVS